jgi:hypothetical protein
MKNIEYFKVESVEIDASEAKELLANADALGLNPRRRQQRTIDRYAQDMAAGVWGAGSRLILVAHPQGYQTPEGRFALVDGQHRLSGQIASGTTQRYLVQYGADSALIAGLDTGAVRSIAVTHGVEKSVAAIANMLFRAVAQDGVPRSVTARAVKDLPEIMQAHGYRTKGRTAVYCAAIALALLSSGGSDTTARIASIVNDLAAKGGTLSAEANTFRCFVESDGIRRKQNGQWGDRSIATRALATALIRLSNPYASPNIGALTRMMNDGVFTEVQSGLSKVRELC